MTKPQKQVLERLKSEGFTVDHEFRFDVLVHRGNDYRWIGGDGSQRRARGARR